MTFDAFKQEVIRQAKQQKASNLVPGADFLFILWERKVPVTEVVSKHCTLEASRRRHGITVTKP